MATTLKTNSSTSSSSLIKLPTQVSSAGSGNPMQTALNNTKAQASQQNTMNKTLSGGKNKKRKYSKMYKSRKNTKSNKKKKYVKHNKSKKSRKYKRRGGSTNTTSTMAVPPLNTPYNDPLKGSGQSASDVNTKLSQVTANAQVAGKYDSNVNIKGTTNPVSVTSSTTVKGGGKKMGGTCSRTIGGGCSSCGKIFGGTCRKTSGGSCSSCGKIFGGTCSRKHGGNSHIKWGCMSGGKTKKRKNIRK